ncbi:MAG: tetratricopeptide repeat protein, partial [Gemmatimonadetes bacterium]|nr:tetratricopeptide repeat protein [Gemmatimonadota bacterium]
MVPPGTLRPRAAARATTRADAAFDAAVALQLAGDVLGAERAWRRYLIDAPRHAAAHNNLGGCLAARGERGAALACFATAAELDPAYGDAFHNFGLVLAQVGQHADAIAPLTRAVELAPTRAAWWADLGSAQVGAGRDADALASFARGLAIAPGDPALLLAQATPLRALGRVAEAVTSIEGVLARVPNAPQAWANLGLLRRDQRDLDGAVQALERALALDPKSALALAELSSTLVALGRLAPARRAAEWLTAEHGLLPEAWDALGAVAFEQGDYDVATACYDTALTLRPDDIAANWNRALLELLRGDVREGFMRFEHRKRVRLPGQPAAPALPHEWDGRALDGERVLVLAEQGLGDQLQFARYLPALKALGASHVSVECAPTLAPLLATLPGIDVIVPAGAPLPAADLHARLLGFPLRLGTTLDTIPLAEGYLEAPARPVADRVRALAGPRIGLAWAGNPLHTRDRVRSVPFTALAPLLDVEGVRFVSLQKGTAAAALALAPHVLDLGPWLDDLADAAAAIAELDLLVTVDSALAHLAGALGVPTWTMLPHVPDWRWRLETSDTPWYDSMRLVRQPARDAWAPVVGAVADGVRRIASGEAAEEVEPVVQGDAPARVMPGGRPVAIAALDVATRDTAPSELVSPSASGGDAARDRALRTPVVIGWPAGVASGVTTGSVATHP